LVHPGGPFWAKRDEGAWSIPKGEFEDNEDPLAAAIKSNTFSLEWPPKSGRYQEFPEIDRAAWFTIEEASHKILKGQAAFLVQLQQNLGAPCVLSEEGGSTTGKSELSRQRSLFDEHL